VRGKRSQAESGSEKKRLVTEFFDPHNATFFGGMVNSSVSVSLGRFLVGDSNVFDFPPSIFLAGSEN
jgi:hypothetical protein